MPSRASRRDTGSAGALRLALAALAIVLAAAPARADRIDGEWCHLSSSLKIDGPTIRTPGNSVLTGDYSRHGFTYTVPAGEPEAGTQIVMVLRNDELMELTRAQSGVTQPTERWQRCKPVS